jgi:hypothetical protein
VISRRVVALSAISACLVALALGCSTDVAKQMVSSPAMQTQIMGAIASHPDLAGRMVDQLLAADSTREALLERALSNADGAQEIMREVARDQAKLDGTIGLAVQDSAMSEHVFALVKGMEMARRK